MEPGTARIGARSRRQAMDWSLVLASQEIPVTISQADETGGWELLVAQADYDRALEVIRQYQLENRAWPWQQAISERGVLFDWGSLAWVALVLLFYWLEGRTGFRSAGYMDTTAVARGQWWRLFTAVWLHADIGHVACNAVFGFILLGLAMGAHGTAMGLLASYLAGVGGNLASWLLASEPHISLGASGMVMGSLGLISVHSFSEWRRNRQASRLMLIGGVGGLMLFVLMGLTPGTDILAHFGGFLSGVVLGLLLGSVPDVAARTGLNVVGSTVFALLVILPWWLALNHRWR